MVNHVFSRVHVRERIWSGLAVSLFQRKSIHIALDHKNTFASEQSSQFAASNLTLATTNIIGFNLICEC